MVRYLAWGLAGALLLLPLIAMQFTDEVAWSAHDFAIAAVLLGGSALLFDLAVRRARDFAYRAGAGVAVVAALLLVWINLAVGVSILHLAVLTAAAAGTFVARARPEGMARAMVATAAVQALVGVLDLPLQPETVVVAAFFSVVWLAAAWLFRRSAAII